MTKGKSTQKREYKVNLVDCCCPCEAGGSASLPLFAFSRSKLHVSNGRILSPCPLKYKNQTKEEGKSFPVSSSLERYILNRDVFLEFRKKFWKPV